MKHILVVDDDKTNLMMAKEALSSSYKVTAVTKGTQALAFLEKNTCDLILLDLMMPEMDGFEVMSRIQQMEGRENIPIIFLTADNDAAVESKCLEEGAQDFIAKPFVKRVMLSRIERLLELEELREELADRLEKKTREVIDIQSRTQKDALTGLWNRAYTEKLINEKLAAGEKGAVFMMDMDNFKAINDSYGHLAGDKVLKMFADTLEAYAHEGDVLCRIGGDEFMAFIKGNLTKKELEKRASEIIFDVDRKLQECKFETNSSVSVGIAQAGTDGNGFHPLYNAADKALYFAKLNGKNTYHFFSDQEKLEGNRASNMVDLKQISELMARDDNGKGVYHLDYDNFHHVYNFIRRFVKRNHREVHTILFTAQIKKDDIRKGPIDGVMDGVMNGVIEATELEKAIGILEIAVYESLRKVDVSSRYSSKQLIVMLMDSNLENSERVAARILKLYSELAAETTAIRFEFGIAGMEKE